MSNANLTKANPFIGTAHLVNNFRNGEQYDMIVFCHLRWEFVYQRPQHIISRFSKNYKILLIEEPIGTHPEGHPGLLNKISDQLHVLQPCVNSISEIADILPHFLTKNTAEIGWFYSAAFVPLLEQFSFDAIVYDCMDELTLFKGAPAELITQEKFLVANANIVFTGGKSLYESKKTLHNNVYCFPSSVDQEHFASALNGIAIPEDCQRLNRPIAGYYGVIDERIDMELLEQTALMNPDVDFVIVGPLAKISENDLPKPGNIHYPGMKSYEELPGYLKAFDVAIMPFAMNEATRYISPTKTLEYMSAFKPIISTPVRDVVRDYSHCVSIVETASEFSDVLRSILKEDANDLRIAAYSSILERTSWDNTVAKMNLLISKTAKS